MNKEPNIIRDIESDIFVLKEKSENVQTDGLERKWLRNVYREPKRFINPDLTINKEALRNFRKLFIFVPDVPIFNPTPWDLINILGGGRRASKRLLMDCLDILIKNGYDALLKKYPCSHIGNPYAFKYKGYSYTHRWTRHIHLLGLFKKVLGETISDNFVMLDIGSSYGIFSHLMKKEFKKAHCILVDFPEQLVLARYFLAMNNPELSIAGFKEVLNANQLDRDFFKKYDFILVPLTRYKKIMPHSTDMVTNFVSFCEMKREWLNYYIENEPFLSTKYFFTVNRFRSAPEFDSDLTILDYKLEKFKKLHFTINPILEYTYKRQFLFFYHKYVYSSRQFEFIGERK